MIEKLRTETDRCPVCGYRPEIGYIEKHDSEDIYTCRDGDCHVRSYREREVWSAVLKLSALTLFLIVLFVLANL